MASINQFIISKETQKTQNVEINGSITSLSIYGMPGSIFCLDNVENKIKLNHTGIFQIDSLGEGNYVKKIIIPTETLNKYTEENNQQMIIDYITEEG